MGTIPQISIHNIQSHQECEKLRVISVPYFTAYGNHASRWSYVILINVCTFQKVAHTEIGDLKKKSLRSFSQLAVFCWSVYVLLRLFRLYMFGYYFLFKGRFHPPFWTFLSALRKDWALTDTQLQQSALGIPVKRRKRRTYVQHQRRLKVLCQRYDVDGNMEGFLRAIGPSIRINKAGHEQAP